MALKTPYREAMSGLHMTGQPVTLCGSGSTLIVATTSPTGVTPDLTNIPATHARIGVPNGCMYVDVGVVGSTAVNLTGGVIEVWGRLPRPGKPVRQWPYDVTPATYTEDIDDVWRPLMVAGAAVPTRGGDITTMAEAATDALRKIGTATFMSGTIPFWLAGVEEIVVYPTTTVAGPANPILVVQFNG